MKKRTAPDVTPPGDANPRPGRLLWLAALVIAAAICAAYANSLSIPFVLDDEGTVVQNADIRQLTDLRRVLLPGPDTAAAGRPVVSLSLALNYAVGGQSPSGYHAVNLALHLACALLIFGIVRRTLAGPPWSAGLQAGAVPVAVVSALVWGVHPLTSEVVNYVTQRTEAMAALWILAALYAARRWHDAPGSRWDGVSIACGILGVLSKETAVVTPVLVILYDRAFLAGTWRAAWRDRGSLYLGLGASWFVLAAMLWSGPRAAVSGFSAGIAPWTYLLNQAVVIVDYLRLAVWPVGLVAFWGWPMPLTLADVWPQFAVVAALAVGSVAWFVAAPRLGLCAVWFFVTLAPTSSFVPIATEVGADRRMYLPLAALVTLVVASCWHATGAARKDRARWLAVPAAVLVGVLGWATVARNREYATPLSLAQTIVDRRPTAVAHQILGEQLVIAKRPDEAAAAFRQAVSLGNTRALFPLAVLTLNRGDATGAVPLFTRVVEQAETAQTLQWLRPPLSDVLNSRLIMAQTFASQRRWVETEAQTRAILARAPGHVLATRLLGAALIGQLRWAEAITLHQPLVEARPGDVEARINLGIALAGAQRFTEARNEFARAVSTDPQNASARRLLDLATRDAQSSAGTSPRAR